MNRNSFQMFFERLFSKKVVTRIAPSPTGSLHIGTARSALFNFLFARHYGGTFIVRIEDTDVERSRKEYEEDILDGLKWLGLSYDGFFRQSERGTVYARYIKQLVKGGHAYISKEENKKENGKIAEVVRLKNPGTNISFKDIIRGDIAFNTKELGDFVIARSKTEPLYHLAAVVDDHEMGITHVIRGEDHISNTPRQILIQRALGIREPAYAHIPLILASDRSKLSKRKGSTSITEFREQGYLPEAMLNYLAFLGWNPGTEREIYTIDKLIKHFSLTHVQKSGAVFDAQKLDWFNREHLKRIPQKQATERIIASLSGKTKKLSQYSDVRVEKATETIIERINTFKELAVLSEKGEFDYLFSAPKMEAEIPWKKDSSQSAASTLTDVVKFLEAIQERAFTKETVKGVVWEYAKEKGKGTVLWPMRVALSGKEKSPDPFTLAEIFGRDETLLRLQRAIQQLT